MTDHEWGPWIEHDGRKCPESIVGKTCQVEFVRESDKSMWIREYVISRLIASCASWEGLKFYGKGYDGQWDGKEFPMEYVIRYRIRKPRALQQLKELVENLPDTEGVE